MALRHGENTVGEYPSGKFTSGGVNGLPGPTSFNVLNGDSGYLSTQRIHAWIGRYLQRQFGMHGDRRVDTRIDDK